MVMMIVLNRWQYQWSSVACISGLLFKLSSLLVIRMLIFMQMMMITIMLLLLMLISMLMLILMLTRHEPSPSHAWLHAPHRLFVDVDFQHCNYFYDGGHELVSTLAYVCMILSILVLMGCFSLLSSCKIWACEYFCSCWISLLNCINSIKVPIVEAVLVELDLQHLAGDGEEGEVGNFDQKELEP